MWWDTLYCTERLILQGKIIVLNATCASVQSPKSTVLRYFQWSLHETQMQTYVHRDAAFVSIATPYKSESTRTLLIFFCLVIIHAVTSTPSGPWANLSSRQGTHGHICVGKKQQPSTLSRNYNWPKHQLGNFKVDDVEPKTVKHTQWKRADVHTETISYW